MHIKEIFYSFQGEGPFVGYPQLFIRFYGCNIHCAYCDEPDYIQDRHNYSADQLMADIAPYLDKPIHSIAITGGEPLIQVQALQEILPRLPRPIYLETNGTLPHQLSQVKDHVTYFSVDYKTGFLDQFAAFMSELKGRKHVFVKYVMVDNFLEEDILQACQIMADIDPTMPFIIQPVTPFADITYKASPERIHTGFELASRYLTDVRIIPQTHKFIGVR